MNRSVEIVPIGPASESRKSDQGSKRPDSIQSLRLVFTARDVLDALSAGLLLLHCLAVALEIKYQVRYFGAGRVCIAK